MYLSDTAPRGSKAREHREPKIGPTQATWTEKGTHSRKTDQNWRAQHIQMASSTRCIQQCASPCQGTRRSRDTEGNVKHIVRKVPGMKTRTCTACVQLLCTRSSNFQGKHTSVPQDIQNMDGGYRTGYPYTQRTHAINQRQDGHSVHQSSAGNGQGSRKK